MNKLKSIVAVTLVTAFCIVSMCPSASAVAVNSEFSFSDYYNNGLFVPSPDYPSAESLPYGSDTLIYQIPKKIDGGVLFWRIYIRRDMDVGSSYSIWNGTTALWTIDSATALIRNFNYQFVSKAPIYYQTFTIMDDDIYTFDFSSVTKVDSGNVYDGVTYPTFSLRGQVYGVNGGSVGYFYPASRSNSDALIGGRFATPQIIANIPNYEKFEFIRSEDGGSFYYTNANARYPSSSDLQSMRDKVTNDKLDGIQDSINNGVNDIKDALNEGVTLIEGAINEGVSDILNAGQELPTVDTNNDWMNDSVTKVNEWLSQLEEFEEQMQGNLEENQQNMESARDFILSFFQSLPVGLITGLSLGLVMIVVVKLIGR